MTKSKNKLPPRKIASPGPGWRERAECAALFGVTVRQFDSRHRQLVPADAAKTIGRSIYFDWARLLKAFVTAEVTTAMQRTGGDDAAMMIGGDSPALEKWRQHRADLSELDLKERRGELCRREDYEPVVLEALRIMQRAGREIELRYGRDAGDFLRESITEGAAAYARACGETPKEIAARVASREPAIALERKGGSK